MSDYDDILQSMYEAFGEEYNESLYDSVYTELENVAGDMRHEYWFSPDVRDGSAAQDVYDWIRKNKSDTFQNMLRDPEIVSGNDAMWSALEALGKVKPWEEFTEEDADSFDYKDYELWKAITGL